MASIQLKRQSSERANNETLYNIIAPENRELSPVTRPKNKCGPGQPPGPHRFCVTFCDPCPRTRHGGVHLSRAPRSAVFDALGRSPPAKRTSQVDLQHHGGRRPVLPCVEDSVRRPQRPGNQSRAEARSWRIPPSHSPSRIAGHRRLCRYALAGHADRLARCQHCAPAGVFASSKNPGPFVQKLWMLAIPCGSSWKIGTVLSRIFIRRLRRSVPLSFLPHAAAAG